MTQRYTLDDVRNALCDIIARRGQYERLYNVGAVEGVRCVYSVNKAPDGAPACIAGAIVRSLDVRLFEKIAGVYGTWAHVPIDVHERFTYEANEYLGDLQSWADRGTPWDVCLAFTSSREPTDR